MKRLLSLVLSIAMVITLTPAVAFAGSAGAADTQKREENCPSAAFRDLDTSQWYHAATDYVITNKIMNGTSVDTFEPDTELSRAMIVRMLWNLENQPSGAKDAVFTDVESGAWYQEAVNWAAANDIVTGYSKDRFGPDDSITREQTAAILNRYAAFKKYDVSASGALDSFTDAAQVSDWALDNMKWAVGAGLINGMGDGTVSPQGTATRAQVAQMFLKFSGAFGKKTEDNDGKKDEANPSDDNSGGKDPDQSSDNKGSTKRNDGKDTSGNNSGNNGSSSNTGGNITPSNPSTGGNTGGQNVDPSTDKKDSGQGGEQTNPDDTKKDEGDAGKKEDESGSGNVTKKDVTVTFDADGGSAVESQTIKNGEKAVKPVDPTKNGNTFIGWYTDGDTSVMFDFDTPVENSLTLKAVWFDGSNMPAGLDKIDSDGDGLSDWLEINTFNYDPLKKDSDGNGTADGEEDYDKDGLTNAEEVERGTDPADPDTDGDGISDGDEVKNGTDPLKKDSNDDGVQDGIKVETVTGDNGEKLVKTKSEKLKPSEANPVTASAEVITDAKGAGTLDVREVTNADNYYVSYAIPGYLDSAYEFSCDGDVSSRTITMYYDQSLADLGDQFKPAIYYLDDDGSMTRLAEQSDNRNDKAVTASVEHFSTYMLLNEAEYTAAYNQTIKKSAIPSSKDLTKDSNSDGIGDYYTELINDGKILTRTGVSYAGVTEMYGTNDPDWDGDGLNNGEEMKVVEESGSLYLEITSDPVLVDSDNDGFTDKEEKDNNTPPLTYTVDQMAALLDLWDDSKYHYDGLADSDWTLVDVYDFQKTEGAKAEMINFIYNYASEDTITANQERIAEQQAWEEYLKCFQIASNIVKTAKNISSITDDVESMTSGTSDSGSAKEYVDKLKSKEVTVKGASAKVNVSRRTLLNAMNTGNLSGTEATKGLLGAIDTAVNSVADYQKSFSDMSDITGTAEELTGKWKTLSSTLVSTVGTAKTLKNAIGYMKLDNGFQKISDGYSTFLSEKGELSTSTKISVALTVVDGGLDIWNTANTYGKIMANQDAFLTYESLFDDISRNAKYSYVKRAAAGIAKQLREGTWANESQFLKAGLQTVALTSLDVFTSCVPTLALIKGTMSAVSSIGGLTSAAKYVTGIRADQAISDSSKNILNDWLDNNGSETYFSYDRANESQIMDYLTQLAQIRLVGENATDGQYAKDDLGTALSRLAAGKSKEEIRAMFRETYKKIYDDAKKLQLILSDQLPSYNDYEHYVKTDTPKQWTTIGNTGDIIMFGTYEQDNDLTNGPEPIEWQVLDKKDGKALVISKKLLCEKRYDDSYKHVEWKKCSLRKWLNEDFISSAFTENEKGKILETSIVDTGTFNRNGALNTTDKVFLLSGEEVDKYFKSSEDKRAEHTTYCCNYVRKYCKWWLRRMSNYYSGLGFAINFITEEGEYFSGASMRTIGSVDNGYGVRPAMWVKVAS